MDQTNGMTKADRMLAEAQRAKRDESVDYVVQPLVDNLARGAIVGMQVIPPETVLRSIARCTAVMLGKFYGGPDNPDTNKQIADFRSAARREFSKTLHETPIAGRTPLPAPAAEQAQPADQPAAAQDNAAQADPGAPQPDNAIEADQPAAPAPAAEPEQAEAKPA